jgi:hypothetical protein
LMLQRETGHCTCNLITQETEFWIEWAVGTVPRLHKSGHTRLRADHKYPESFEMLCWRRMENTSRTDNVKNEVLQGIMEERNILHTG